MSLAEEAGFGGIVAAGCALRGLMIEDAYCLEILESLIDVQSRLRRYTIMWCEFVVCERMNVCLRRLASTKNSCCKTLTGLTLRFTVSEE